jgi:hypothetical protein
VSSIDSALGAAAKNDTARQLFIWGLLYGLISAVFTPVGTTIGQEAWAEMVDHAGSRKLTPAELAVMVVRGWKAQDQAWADAKQSGVSDADFDLMVKTARNPIAPQEAAVAARRGIITDDWQATTPADNTSFLAAIQRGDTGDEWAKAIHHLATQIPSPADILQAVLQGQVPAGVDPRALYERVGGEATDPKDGFDWYTLMFNTRGSAPTPMEALEMWKRGIMPLGDGSDGRPVVQGPGAISYWQAFLEGPWRNKWEPAFRALAEYFPPPRSVVAMLHNGSISPAQATDWLTKQGLAPATIDAYIRDATRTKTAAVKHLSESNILTLLNEKLIDQATAIADLEELGYPANEATQLATTSAAAIAIADTKSAVARIRAYYIGRKINRATALSELAALGVDSASAQAKLAGWDIDRRADVHLLSPAQIESAWEYGIFTQAEAQQELEWRGYTALDAWTLLSIKAKQALPNKPAGPSGLGPA